MKKQNGKVSLLTLLVAFAVVAVVGIGAAIFLYSNNSWNLMLQGANMPKVEVEAVAVPAAGTDIRVYSFTDPHGRVCTGAYSENAAWGDCDFPPTGPSQ